MGKLNTKYRSTPPTNLTKHKNLKEKQLYIFYQLDNGDNYTKAIHICMCVCVCVKHEYSQSN